MLNDYTRYIWNQGLELVALTLDRWEYAGDERFLQEDILPMAESVLFGLDTRFKKGADGRIVLDDQVQAVETYWFGVTNDMPNAAGLNAVSARLRAPPARLTTPRQRAFFAKMKAACPAIPMEEVDRDGRKIRKLAPADKQKRRLANCENPELYAVWPFRLYGLGKPELDMARAAYALRRWHLRYGLGLRWQLRRGG